MVLLEIDAPRIAIDPFERYPPRPVHTDAVPLGFSSQSVKGESRHIQIADVFCSMERPQPSAAPIGQVLTNFSRVVVEKQGGESLVAEAPDHAFTLFVGIQTVKSYVTVLPGSSVSPAPPVSRGASAPRRAFLKLRLCASASDGLMAPPPVAREYAAREPRHQAPLRRRGERPRPSTARQPRSSRPRDRSGFAD